MDELLLTGLAAAPIITALVAAIGAAVPKVPRRCYPLLAIALGAGWQCATAAVTGELTPAAALAGIVIGLAASGLYSGAVKPALALAQAERGA
jgi:hypothetical protein